MKLDRLKVEFFEILYLLHFYQIPDSQVDQTVFGLRDAKVRRREGDKNA
jgi:hypothetical protein